MPIRFDDPEHSPTLHARRTSFDRSQSFVSRKSPSARSSAGGCRSAPPILCRPQTAEVEPSAPARAQAQGRRADAAARDAGLRDARALGRHRRRPRARPRDARRRVVQRRLAQRRVLPRDHRRRDPLPRARPRGQPHGAPPQPLRLPRRHRARRSPELVRAALVDARRRRCTPCSSAAAPPSATHRRRRAAPRRSAARGRASRSAPSPKASACRNCASSTYPAASPSATPARPSWATRCLRAHARRRVAPRMHAAHRRGGRPLGVGIGGCSSLRSFDLSWCSELADGTALALAEGLARQSVAANSEARVLHEADRRRRRRPRACARALEPLAHEPRPLVVPQPRPRHRRRILPVAHAEHDAAHAQHDRLRRGWRRRRAATSG